MESTEDTLPGYYINQNEVIIIDSKSNSTTVLSQTSPISILDKYYRCDSLSQGKIYNSTSPIYCLDGINKVELNEENKGIYLLSYTDDNIFNIPVDQYGLIHISKNKAVLDINQGINFYIVYLHIYLHLYFNYIYN